MSQCDRCSALPEDSEQHSTRASLQPGCLSCVLRGLDPKGWALSQEGVLLPGQRVQRPAFASRQVPGALPASALMPQ